MSVFKQFLLGMLILLGSILTAAVARASFNCVSDEFNTGWSRTVKPFKLLINSDGLAISAENEKGTLLTLLAKPCHCDAGEYLVSRAVSSQKVFSPNLDSSLKSIVVSRPYANVPQKIRVEMRFDQDFGAYSNFYNCQLDEQ